MLHFVQDSEDDCCCILQTLNQSYEALLKEVAQLKEKMKELEKLAQEQGVTGLFNFKIGQSRTEKSAPAA